MLWEKCNQKKGKTYHYINMIVQSLKGGSTLFLHKWQSPQPKSCSFAHWLAYLFCIFLCFRACSDPEVDIIATENKKQETRMYNDADDDSVDENNLNMEVLDTRSLFSLWFLPWCVLCTCQYWDEDQNVGSCIYCSFVSKY